MFEELNAEQKEAVATINGPVRIIAGAGTGKTKTLVSRVANMLQKGISAENIMLLTFTNKAAGEMKLRIQNYIGNDRTRNLTACTFHSFCNRFLKQHANLSTEPPSVMSALYGTQLVELSALMVLRMKYMRS